FCFVRWHLLHYPTPAGEGAEVVRNRNIDTASANIANRNTFASLVGSPAIVIRHIQANPRLNIVTSFGFSSTVMTSLTSLSSSAAPVGGSRRVSVSIAR